MVRYLNDPRWFYNGQRAESTMLRTAPELTGSTILAFNANELCGFLGDEASKPQHADRRSPHRTSYASASHRFV